MLLWKSRYRRFNIKRKHFSLFQSSGVRESSRSACGQIESFKKMFETRGRKSANQISAFENQNSLLIKISQRMRSPVDDSVFRNSHFHLKKYTMQHKEWMESGSNRLKLGELHGPLNDGSKRLTVRWSLRESVERCPWIEYVIYGVPFGVWKWVYSKP